MRIIKVVLRNDETVQQEQTVTYIGEHRAVQLQVTLPQRLRNGFDYYTLSFDPMDKGNRVPIGNIYPGQQGMAYTQNGIIFCDLPQPITNANFVRVQVEGHCQAHGKCIAIEKSASFVLEFEQGIAGQGEALHAFALGHMNELMAQLDAARQALENWTEDAIVQQLINAVAAGIPSGPPGPPGPAGGSSISMPNTDFNEVRVEGTYRVNMATTNGPFATGSGATSGTLVYLASNINVAGLRGTQMFYSNNGRIFTRNFMAAANWSAWREVSTANSNGRVEWITPHGITFADGYFDRNNTSRMAISPFGQVTVQLNVAHGTAQQLTAFPTSGNVTIATLPTGFRPHTASGFSGVFVNRTTNSAAGTVLHPVAPVRVTSAGLVQVNCAAGLTNATSIDMVLSFMVQ
ncbi:MAG: pyocin knob domain-containing protein [Oscillospiraceae bacterium]|nr:pyocin knob domain-containing protein [Oscillospiraceae bacterium]